mmetsp:Transcript_39615/g.109146  ORF Transcript_39615/g.109146 Transcript_39615/m.109146 type:complete len:231 (+) Transcript_39615:855-1547(+)
MVGEALATIEHLDLDALQPQEIGSGIAQSTLLQKRPRLGELLLPDLAFHGAKPQRHTPGAFLETSFEKFGGFVQLRWGFFHVDLPTNHPHFGKCRMLLETLLAQVKRLLEQALLSLELHGLHPNLGRVALLSGSGQQQAATLNLIVFALQLHCRQVDGLGLLGVTESLGKDAPRSCDVSPQPLLLRSHEPQDLCVRAVCHRALQHVVEGLGGAVLCLQLREPEPKALLVF